MGIPSTMRDAWANRRNSPLIASPAEDQKILNSRRCTQEGVRAGVKAASIACVGSAVPTINNSFAILEQLESADLVILEEEDDATSVANANVFGVPNQAQIDLDAKKLQSYVKEKSLMSEKVYGTTQTSSHLTAKQSFFHDENRANLFEVEPASRMLLNTDNGTPMPQEGNVGHLHKLLGIESSSQVLYVGDHIYGDILRSKKVLAVTWIAGLGDVGWGVGGIDAEATMLGQTCMKWVAVFSSSSKGAKENAASASPKPVVAGNSDCNARNFLERYKIWSKN
ncbi:hypothetical protein HYC85_027392 [Camellia sinensis]|uniref:Uncharacterized protein n=1 Tax=Camellia sinensis TaxID=4442 RepID=A0A7J7G6A3_CAMSI|nr:hypothetical protein HYC85_027392 [Camellia sinensis]